MHRFASLPHLAQIPCFSRLRHCHPHSCLIRSHQQPQHPRKPAMSHHRQLLMRPHPHFQYLLSAILDQYWHELLRHWPVNCLIQPIAFSFYISWAFLSVICSSMSEKLLLSLKWQSYDIKLTNYLPNLNSLLDNNYNRIELPNMINL
jgi:hypothetical protein